MSSIRLSPPVNIFTGSPPISALPLGNVSTSAGFDDLKNADKAVDPWEVCNGYTKKHTEDLCESWRDEIDKLLIFAGLFSGVVTAFTIESYHSVIQDPAETTALLLQTIVLQLDNITNPQSNTSINLNPQMEPVTQKTKRINALWFLSLALSLSTVMTGILCLQWIREYSRNANVSHREDVALHHMHYEGMKKWQVFKILNVLPLLLIAALLLFFIGFIELLWEVDKTAAILICIVVGIMFFVIFATTVLPTFQCLYACAFPHARFTQCPYKSPQAWMFQKVVASISYLVYRIRLGPAPPSTVEPPSKFSDLFKIQTWLDYDQFLRRRRDANGKYGTQDVGRSLAWLGDTFVQHQRLVEAVCQCLRDLDPRIALEASLAWMDRRRANSVRRAIQDRPAPNSPDHRRSQTEITRDLIVSHTLEHFAENMEQGHMSPTLLAQRLELFLKLNEGEGRDPDVECPVNRQNVNLITRDTKERLLRCICTMLNKNTNCNATHTTGAFEIIRSIFMDNLPNGPIPQVVSDTLGELLKWIAKEPSHPVPTEMLVFDPEERLRLGVPFHGLIFVCKGESDRNTVDRYRQQMNDYIEKVFGKELDDLVLGDSMRNVRFPYLTRYMTSRGMNFTSGSSL
ncbi:hypothetical protein P691DRAFT_700655 [Macrolepiota fuliginosa MF-IS2]|uniref:DUF6535 domain-containing protein n=1 Tax=Macrolepiota fuliginosa MF-IS2 TaxID=1400762 RepID=A0A9P6C718_9AGAR|nr:hypothetical protein P691DRAFT_700655 [Macrolepiota fuliginosa MF-IS2]